MGWDLVITVRQRRFRFSQPAIRLKFFAEVVQAVLYGWLCRDPQRSPDVFNSKRTARRQPASVLAGMFTRVAGLGRIQFSPHLRIQTSVRLGFIN